jgi:urease accessory protein
MHMATSDAATALRRLLTWLSPAFPVGGFSYSHGLEWSIEAGDIRDRAGLVSWLEALLRHGAGRSDAILLAASWRAALDGRLSELLAIAELAAALAPGRERHLETTAQGAAFLKAVRTAWAAPLLDDLAGEVADGLAYPVAVGAAVAVHGVPLEPTIHAYLTGFVASLVSAGVRLIPLGQSDALISLAALDEIVSDVARGALSLGLDDLGGFVIRADIAALRHETQHTRLFRS